MRRRTGHIGGQRGTSLRYRCQVAWPSTGITTIRPRSAGSDPSTRPPATIRPHTAIGTGSITTAWIDVAAEPMAPIAQAPVVVGLDFGLTPAAVFCQRTAMGRWLVLGELVSEDMG